MAATAITVFGTLQQAAELIKKFDWSKMEVKDATRDDYLHLNLAPSFGELTPTSVKDLDDNLKVIIAATMRALAKVPAQQRSWEKVLEVMMQNPLLEPDAVGISRADKLIKEEVNYFHTDGSPDPKVVKEVENWFINLIEDDDVLKSTQIDIKVMANIVAQTGATIDSFPALIYKEEYHEKTMVDVGVLRFPDTNHPHFKLYRIQLIAWSDSRRIVFGQKDENGITGEFNSRIFNPRVFTIQELSPTVKKQAITEADDLFA
ncbi:hypothetical protein MSAN_00512800 [Mycena sanguinolenta]|uniref:Uncharacterized protein n=1 Tax=Mycena sanguinolenta TaxID=230812 RepID=A0A8H6Z5Q1_9AGAR|nr:hypothetical protein MSAN_00512800 [Mycena sanguinolenta]